IPNFLVQAVVRSEPALRDRAVAIVDGTPPVWSVVATNEAAAKTGIAIGMTKSQVQQFFGIEIRHRSPASERAAHAALLDLGWSLSPRVEDTAPDTVVLDLAGLNSLLGPDEQIANQLAERAARLGLLAHIAVASQMESAIVAARGFAGLTVIPEGADAETLGRLSVNALSPSLEVLETLERWGVRTCAELAALPVLQLSERLGQEGVRLHELAQGKSGRAVVLAEPAAHFEEEMELEDAVEELEPLSFLLGRLLGQVCARLEARSLAACAVRVRFVLDSSFEADVMKPAGKDELQSTQRKTGARGEVRLPQKSAMAGRRRERRGNNGALRSPKTYERVLSLPTPIRNPKTLLNLVRLHLQSDPPTAPIVKIILAADAARPRVAQAGLFLPSSPDPEKLELTIARLANVVGDSNIGSPELVDTHRPGDFRMKRFAADAVETEPRRKSQNANATSVCERCSLQALRVFRPALAAKVDLCDGSPVRIRFQGMDGRVIAASGPWRSSGDWWREDGWQNDEWDLEVVFSPAVEPRANASFLALPMKVAACAANEAQHSFYRIFFDSIRNEWFVRGAYD
ncbi:MAG TPA: DNA polymerase Y family protein, partial [Candidatus Acidoferrales bacterium]|nr:DNA polymerase Y family protein [Candidatus Acidoferrales bacterium]